MTNLMHAAEIRKRPSPKIGARVRNPAPVIMRWRVSKYLSVTDLKIAEAPHG